MSGSGSKLENLRGELGQPSATALDICRHYAETLFLELATKLGIPPDKFNYQKLYFSLDGSNEYPELTLESCLKVLAELGLTEKSLLRLDPTTNEVSLDDNNRRRAGRTLKYYYLQRLRHELENRIGIERSSDELTFGMMAEYTWKEGLRRILSALE